MVHSTTLSFANRLRVLAGIADGLAAIHDCRICHRDLKPDNILVTRQVTPKIVDFGIARQAALASMTDPGEICGTPLYMAPEAFAGMQMCDSRADLFSLGILAYELLLGIHPFKGSNIRDIARNIKHQKPTEPRRIQPEFPLYLQDLLAGLLKKDPEQRLNSAAVVHERLLKMIETGFTGAPGSASLLSRFRHHDWS